MSEISGSLPAKKERIGELDSLRAMAFLAVVMQHTLGVYIRNSDIQLPASSMLGMLFNFMKFAVPTFIFITGIALFYNYYDGVRYLSFIKKRTLEILVPYVLWTFVYELYLNNGLPKIDGEWWIGMIKAIALGREYYHLWYIPMIFQFYLLFPLLLWGFKSIRNCVRTAVGTGVWIGAFTLAYAWLMWFTVSYIGGGHLHVHGWLLVSMVRFLDRNFLFWIFYFGLGAIAGASILAWRKFVRNSVSWNGFLFIGLFLWVGYELMRSALRGTVDLNFSTSLKPSMFFYTGSEILLLYGLAMLISSRKSILSACFKWIGDYSYGAYLAHAFVLTYSIRLTQHLIHGSHYLEKTVFCFTVCSAATLLLVYAISKIPFGRFFIGSVKRAPKKESLRPTVPAEPKQM